MSYQLLDGRATSLKVQESIASEVESRVSKGLKATTFGCCFNW